MDERIRKEARRLAPLVRSGDVRAAVRLATLLARGGEITAPSDYYTQTGKPLRGYQASMGPDGPDLCIVPVTREGVVYVQIGPYHTSSSGVVKGDSGHFRAPQWRTLPGVPITASGYGSHATNMSRFTIQFQECPGLRGVVWTRPSTGREYHLAGEATLVVLQNHAEITAPDRLPDVQFFPYSHRRPRGANEIRRSVQIALREPLEELVYDWATAHPQAFHAASREISGAEIARRLRQVETAEEGLSRARDRLAEKVLEALDVMGL